MPLSQVYPFTVTRHCANAQMYVYDAILHHFHFPAESNPLQIFRTLVTDFRKNVTRFAHETAECK